MRLYLAMLFILSMAGCSVVCLNLFLKNYLQKKIQQYLFYQKAIIMLCYFFRYVSLHWSKLNIHINDLWHPPRLEFCSEFQLEFGSEFGLEFWSEFWLGILKITLLVVCKITSRTVEEQQTYIPSVLKSFQAHATLLLTPVWPDPITNFFRKKNSKHLRGNLILILRP